MLWHFVCKMSSLYGTFADRLCQVIFERTLREIIVFHSKSRLLLLLGIVTLSFFNVACESENKAEQTMPTLTGSVKEFLGGGGFTYILVESGGREHWVAVPETKVEVGEDVSVYDGRLMRAFPSKSLNRTFEELIIAPGLVGKAPRAGGSSPHGLSENTAHLKSTGRPAETPPAKASLGSDSNRNKQLLANIEKASGKNSYTVAELFSTAAGLSGQTVRVRGRVMKVSKNIMGKNWLHIQDGTGDPNNKTHDLVVTSSELPGKGQVVTLEGVLAADKNFGGGYQYPVIIEQGKLLE
ncbi:MAG: DNA-binding protein [Deltaproteobacteria bacterium]|nr:DNA-binding protein [Deltaproteobacteria bacterium]